MQYNNSDDIFYFIYLTILLVISGVLYWLLPFLRSIFLVVIIMLAAVVVFSFLNIFLGSGARSIKQVKTARQSAVIEKKMSKPDNCKVIDYAAQEIKKGICSRCGGKLVLRTAKRGGYKGQKFYGCSNYPKCKNIININE